MRSNIMKIIIYKTLKGYAVTNEQNYNAKIRNAREVHDCSDFSSADEIIEYYCKYFGCNKNDFLVVSH